MKNFAFLLIAFYCAYTTQAQSIPVKTAKALDAYVEVTNKCVANLTKAMSCLEGFNAASLNYKEHQRDGFRSYKTACIDFVDDYYLKTTKERSVALANGERQQVDNAYYAMLGVYKNIVDKCREIEAYVNLQDYQQDAEQQWVEKQLSAIQKEYLQFRTTKREFDKIIYSIYRSHQRYNSGNINHVAEQKMRDAIKLEVEMMDKWAYNLNPKIPVAGIPNAELIHNINQMDSMFQRVEIPKVSLFYKQFIYQLYHGSQKTKRYWLDRNMYDNGLDDSHANSGYKAFVNELNNAAISFFNKFCSNNEDFRGITMTEYSPVFILPNEPVLVDPEPVEYDEIEVKPLTVKPMNRSISVEEAFALNSYVEFVNNAVRVSKSIPRVCESYNRSVISAQENGRKPSKFHHSYPDIPLSYYQSALFNSKYVPEPYREVLNKQAKQLWQIFDELQQSLKQLELSTYGKSNIEPTYEFLLARLKRIAHLIDQFNYQSDELYKNLKLIYNSFTQDQSDPWIKTGQDMTALMDESRQIVEKMYSYIRDSSGVLPSTDDLNTKARTAYLNKHDNLDPINAGRYGTSSSKIEGHYNQIIDDAKKLGELSQLGFEANPRKSASAAEVYEKFVYQYNHLIEYSFNNMVEIPDEQISKFEYFNPYISFKPTSLLKHQKKMIFYDFASPPDKTPEAEQSEPEVTSENVDDLYTSMDGYAINHLVLLLDVSSSMNSPDRLPLLKESLKRLLGIMREEDKISIVIYSEKAKAILKGVSCTSSKVVKELDKLNYEGTTHFNQGMELAYEVADKYFIENGNNRIIVATDGQFNMGSAQYKFIEEQAAKNIAMSVFYFGSEPSENMMKMAESGKGKYSHVTSENSDLVLVKEAKARVKE
ncbi:vWA domain-containing protein [Fulvivirga lutimaris]|uniref:vWA domain-containing protein n=1 Tax=Fulvivirga lutimaris TaxID=1819566 RepID=UPI0012BD2F0B|nr:VWA domain-containing protein [Fulvivirga lutimaris]MTI40041.1 VWA domain-containing protein [Fulvivirga lutimaris]